MPEKAVDVEADDVSKASTRLHQTISTVPSSRMRPFPDIPRLVRRDLPAFQSNNRFQVKQRLTRELWWLLRHDWFHVVLNRRASTVVFILLFIWTAMVVVFGAVYIRVDKQSSDAYCGMGEDGEPITFRAAFAFSLQTCTTVGYTLPNGSNAFFEKCPGLQIAMYVQMVWSMMFNAFLFAFFYTSLAKSSSRGIQVLFSNKAIVSMEGNQVRLQIRIYDLDPTHPVVEAHVRLYAWTKHRPVPRPLRLLQPNDELGALLYMSMPTVVSHHIDAYSMLYPTNNVEFPVEPSGLVLRQADSVIGSREEVVCPICGESFGTHERLVNHVRYNKIMESERDFPVAGSHLSIPESELNRKPAVPITDIDTLQTFFEDDMAEILCVVEGIDPVMSGTFQALQSYRKEDIVWNKNAYFRPCLNVQGSKIEIDLDDFHEVEMDNSSFRSDTQRNPSSFFGKQKLRRKMVSRRKHDSFFTSD